MTSPITSLALLCASALLLLTGCDGPAGVPPSATPTPSAAPLITIELPTEGAMVPSPVQMSGTANTFEAALTVDALDASGNTLCIRNLTASSGSGTPGTWETALAFPPPDGDVAVTLRAYTFSAADGATENLVERPVIVSADHPVIFISEPACGATVSSGELLAVSGQAFVFEAALTVELRDASGSPFASQDVMAARGDEESPWATLLAIPAGLAAGAYDLVAYDLSARDGAIENEFSIQVFVEP